MPAPLARAALLTLFALLAPAVAAAQSGAQPAAQPAAQPIPRDGRWQVRLTSGAYVYDVRPVRATPDTLVVARLDTAAAVTRALALGDIEELRLVQPSTLRFQTGAESPFGELVGADDVVFSLAGVEAAERRRIVAEVLAASRAPSTPARRTP